MERNVAVRTYRPRDTSPQELSDDVDQEMILERWQFQEILKEIAFHTREQEEPFTEA
jgi:hypothetical protein